ncbi:MAG: phosphatidate cytidylyltransferase [Sphingomonadales bacterium]|nr:phosphatidate cytidylyltransferase [Sphingomonadales bacterium]
MAGGSKPAWEQSRDRRLALHELRVRALSAVVMIAVAGGALWLGGPAWQAFIGLVALATYGEFARLIVRGTPSFPARLLWLLFGLGYVGLAAVSLLVLHDQHNAFGEPTVMPVLALVVAVIAVDIGAYVAGRTIGGPKIAPSISPGKTWAGLGGAVVCATLVMLQVGKASLMVALMGPLIAVVAQAGDFFESWLKRRAGLKDSSRLIPGHGGVFDRVDGLIAVAFVFGVLRLVGRGFG